MKKIYLLIIAAGFVSAGGFAQSRLIGTTSNAMNISVSPVADKNYPSVQPMNTSDTITAHWDVIAPVAVDTASLYTCSPTKYSYVAGQNQYGDLAKAQLFDATYGVTSSNGTITNLLLWVGAKKLGANPGNASWTPTIWADNAGKPGTVLGSATAVTVASMDTSLAAKMPIGPLSALKGIYNVNAAFIPAIAIPVTQKFWAGFVITYDNKGDSAGLVTSTDKDTAVGNGNFLDAKTHTFEQWSDNSWNNFYAAWKLNVALAVYPVLDMVTGVNENSNTITALQNIPNPATDNTIVYYNIKETANVEFSLFDITGKKLSTISQGVQSSGNHQMKLDVTGLSSGAYFYTVSVGDFKMTGKMFVVK